MPNFELRIFLAPSSGFFTGFVTAALSTESTLLSLHVAEQCFKIFLTSFYILKKEIPLFNFVQGIENMAF